MKQLIYGVEDDESLRELIKYTLTNDGYEALMFANAEDCLEAFDKRQPSLLLLDIMLPGMDGMEALKIIREKYKNLNVKIIMLTAKNSEINKISGLNGGADDYMTKPFSVLELTARIKAHLRQRAVSVGGGVIEFAGIGLNAASREARAGGEPLNLTYLEFELLKILLENAGTVLERERLLREIWGMEYFGESRTVDIHIKNLRAKMGGYGACIVSARGLGYVLKGSPSGE
ncbi:MAG: response regulator transcription factor [Clostridiales bacterium]|jgi:two-component system alkaline phosphatase synthesis response regulator PhoP|nr:response regulator transcription factor [Clostridiales bacterium]